VTELEDSFAKLLGAQPSDKDRQDLYRVRDALGLKSNDALWLVLMGLQHYQSQYERFPARIEDAARRTLQKFETAADAAARAALEAARRQVTDAAARAAWDVVAKVETRERLRWFAATISVCVVCLTGLAWLMHAKGWDAGYDLGYASGYQAARDEKAAASWAASPEGMAAFELSKAGSVRDLARCSRPGWFVRDGICYPGRAADGLHGWRIDSRNSSLPTAKVNRR
jgi:hypothetical protein